MISYEGTPKEGTLNGSPMDFKVKTSTGVHHLPTTVCMQRIDGSETIETRFARDR